MRLQTICCLIATIAFAGCGSEEGTTLPKADSSSSTDGAADSTKTDTGGPTDSSVPSDEGVDTTTPTDGVADATDSGSPSDVLPDVPADVPEVILDGSTGCHLVVNELQTGSGTVDGGSGATNEF